MSTEENKGNERISAPEEVKRKTEERDDFSAATVARLAANAGHRCSAPGCNIQTAGPAADERVMNRGTASHIIAATPNAGPRHDATVSHEYRKSYENGIWLCATHARQIDSDEVSFPIDLLHRWKRDHEDRVALETKGALIGRGGVVRVAVENLARFHTRQEITFGTRTVIVGSSATGKKLLCDMVATLENSQSAKSWVKAARGKNGRVIVEAFSGAISRFELLFGDTLTCLCEGNPVPSFATPFHVLHFHETFSQTWATSDDNDEAYIAAILDSFGRVARLSRDEVIAALKSIEATPGKFFNQIQFDGKELKCRVRGMSDIIWFEGLSSSERDLVLLDLALRVAEYTSKTAPTILILNQHAFPTYYSTRIGSLLQRLQQFDLQCQIIVTLYEWPCDFAPENWRVWWLDSGTERSCFSREPVAIRPWVPRGPFCGADPTPNPIPQR